MVTTYSGEGEHASRVRLRLSVTGHRAQRKGKGRAGPALHWAVTALQGAPSSLVLSVEHGQAGLRLQLASAGQPEAASLTGWEERVVVTVATRSACPADLLTCSGAADRNPKRQG